MYFGLTQDKQMLFNLAFNSSFVTMKMNLVREMKIMTGGGK
jgi:hypothetical protein